MSKKQPILPVLKAFLETLPAARTPPEIISVTEDVIPCDGGEGSVGHPRVYVTINAKTGFTVCGYCGRIYVQEAGKKSAAH